MVQKLFCLARKNLTLVSILTVGLVARAAAAPALSGISGGDFFNFLLITKELVSFRNPFIAKRLPFYPLLLIPGHLLGHPIGWAKILGVFCSLGILVVLYLLGRQLKIKREVLYLALVFTAFQPALFIYSLRPLTHTLFTLEVLLALYLLYRSNKSYMTYGIVLGLMSMTRHEGFVVAAFLFLCLAVVAKLRFTIYDLRFAVAPFLLLVTPYFVSNYLRFGNFLYSGYAADPGLNRVSSLQSFSVNFEKVKWIILNLWGSTGYFPIKWVLIPTVSALLAFVILRRRFPRFQFLLWGILALLLSLFFILHSSFSPLGFVSFLFACAMILGGLKFVADTRWRGVPLLLVLVTQTILLMIIQPWARHLQHTFPFWALFLALGLNWIFEGLRWILKWSAIVVLGGIVLFNCYGGVKDGIASHQRGVLPAQPLFNAVEFVKDLEGPIAFESNASWVAYYLGDKAVYFAKDLEIPAVDESYKKSPEEQWEWVQENNPKYLVHYNLWDGFSLAETKEFGDHFQLVELFESYRDGEKFTVGVYKVKLPTS